MGNYEMGSQLPIGLGLALEQNKAMDDFYSLSPEEQQRIVDQTHGMQSTKEIAAYVQSVLPLK